LKCGWRRERTRSSCCTWWRQNHGSTSLR
jgi:hypothetical protein